MIQRLPIRWRLTAWNVALLVASLLLFGVGIYFGLRYVLNDNFEEQVRNQGNLTLSAIRVENGRPVIDPAAIANMNAGENLIRLVSATGEVIVDTTSSIEGFPDGKAEIQAALEGSSTVRSWDSANGTFGIVSLPVRRGDSVVGVLQAGSSRSDVDETLRLLVIAMGVAAPIILLFSILGGYILAGHALRPVDRITQLAARIDAEDLDTRLNMRLPDDEVGRLAQTFDAMLARIQDAFERQKRFAGDAAHELRTPLSILRSEVDLALSRPRTPQAYQEAFEEFDQDLIRLTRIVETLLTLARSDTSKLTPDCTPIDVSETIGVVADQYQSRARESGIALLANLEPSNAMLDGDLLVQLAVNLLDNALAHTPSGGSVSISARLEGEFVHISVTDTGGGIPPEHQARVFDRFYRVDPGRSRNRGGAGLGLSICQAIVEAHDGTIGLTGEPGHGTTVEVRLPRK